MACCVDGCLIVAVLTVATCMRTSPSSPSTTCAWYINLDTSKPRSKPWSCEGGFRGSKNIYCCSSRPINTHNTNSPTSGTSTLRPPLKHRAPQCATRRPLHSHSWYSAASAPRPASAQHTSRCQCSSKARAARHCSSAPRRPLAMVRTASLGPALGLQQQSLPALWSRCLLSHSHLRPRPASTCISARRLLSSSNVRRLLRLRSPRHHQV